MNTLLGWVSRSVGGEGGWGLPQLFHIVLPPFWKDLKYGKNIPKVSCPINHCPAEPGYTLPLQTVKKQIDLDLHCLQLSMQIYSNNLDWVIWLAEN